MKKDDVVRVLITDDTSEDEHLNKRWYRVGEKYYVRPYRHNTLQYWELEDWDGISKGDGNFWIKKDQSIIVNQFNFTIPDEVF